jgi:hypothetical protein
MSKRPHHSPLMNCQRPSRSALVRRGQPCANCQPAADSEATAGSAHGCPLVRRSNLHSYFIPANEFGPFFAGATRRAGVSPFIQRPPGAKYSAFADPSFLDLRRRPGSRRECKLLYTFALRNRCPAVLRRKSCHSHFRLSRVCASATAPLRMTIARLLAPDS